MKRKIIEKYIDKWLESSESLEDYLTVAKAIDLRLDEITRDKKSGLITKRTWRDEFKCLKTLQRRLEITLPIMIQSACEIQEYLMLPEHERCGVARYRYLASFKITPQNITRVRGYELIESVGWYCKSFNISGLVKDHRFSVKDGYDRNIDPAIVGHIANCELMSATLNLQKSSTSSITLKQLEKEIRNWQ